MNKKKFTLVATGALISSCLVGCGGFEDPNVEKIDTSKTQIFVNTYDGGYGSAWLSKIKARFEEEHKDDVIETGKKGIQVYISPKKQIADAVSAQILDGRDEVYFTEQSSYFSLYTNGILGDISDVLTETLPGESKTLLDKMALEQKEFYGIEGKDGEKHYYAFPHYSGFFGITYNVDLFDEKGFYFAAKPLSTRLDDLFVTKTNIKKSAGPDGVEGTMDDGLPTTYDEFFNLCRYISKRGCTPFLSNGTNSYDYLNILVNALATTYEGKDEMMKTFTLDGELNNLATINSANELVLDGKPTTVSTENGYEASRMAGKYYGLKFLRTLWDNPSFHNDKWTNTGYTHMNAQRDFLYGGYDGVTQPIAMISDGIWWQNEAKTVFEQMVDAKGEELSEMNRKFAFMPLPQPTKEKADSTKKSTLYDHLFSFAFMKANVSEVKKPIIKEFLKFCNTDISLAEYTITTNTPKALYYSLTEEQKAQMSYYGQSLYERKMNSDIVYPYGKSQFFANNQSKFHTNELYHSMINGKDNQWIINGYKDLNATAEQYFSGMYSYYKDNWAYYVK